MQGIFLPALLLLAFVCIQSSALFLGMARGVRLKKCNPLELTACSQLGYNRTQYSPHLYLSSRRTDVLEYFGLLRLTRCSKDLLFFICMTYQPICFEGYHQAIPPCRSVCESVRDGCLDTITKYGFLWPEELRCEKLPDHQTGVCIKPSAIIKNQSKLKSTSHLQLALSCLHMFTRISTPYNYDSLVFLMEGRANMVWVTGPI